MPRSRRILLLDCTPAQSAGPWFRDALGRCGRSAPETVRPEDGPAVLRGASALLISGSPRDAFARDDWTDGAMKFVEAAIERGLPTLGVCYGHQLLARMAGARVARNPQGWEVGECDIEATGEESPLGLTGRMRVLQSHRDAVWDPPAGCRVLARNAHTPVQAAQWGPAVFGVQFHPEFTGPILRQVWASRRDAWRGRTSFDLDAKLDAAEQCEDGLAVLRRFLEIGT